MNAANDLLATAAEAMSAAGAEVRPVGAARWRVELPGSAAPVLAARVRDGWLEADAPFGPGAENEWKAAASACWRASGAAKLGLLSGGVRLHLRAEVPLDEAENLAASLAETFRGLRQLAGDRPAEAARAGAPPRIDWEMLLGEAGWAGAERSSGTWMTEIVDRAGTKLPVHLETAESGEIVARLVLLRRAPAAPACAAAMGKLLLRANTLIRYAKGGLAEEAGALTAGFAVSLGRDPSPGEVHHALSALTAGCQMCGPELKVLGDEATALRYLRPPEDASGRDDQLRKGDQPTWEEQAFLR